MKLLVIGAHLRRDDIEPLAVALPVASIFLSALEVASDQPLGDRELLLRVTKIRARLLERATFIAIRYGFSATSAEDAASKVTKHVERWRTLLETHRDDVEMTLKVAAGGARPRPNRKDYTNGADYLKALHAAMSTTNVDAAFRAAVEQRIAAKRHRWIPRDEKSVEYVALVGRTDIDRMKEAGEALKRDWPHIPFLLSGPWPLEVFADADHE